MNQYQSSFIKAIAQTASLNPPSLLQLQEYKRSTNFRLESHHARQSDVKQPPIITSEQGCNSAGQFQLNVFFIQLEKNIYVVANSHIRLKLALLNQWQMSILDPQIIKQDFILLCVPYNNIKRFHVQDIQIQRERPRDSSRLNMKPQINKQLVKQKIGCLQYAQQPKYPQYPQAQTPTKKSFEELSNINNIFKDRIPLIHKNPQNVTPNRKSHQQANKITKR
ncbi:hypothetical protein pb186bvf_017287 [Paramecium bursaria]